MSMTRIKAATFAFALATPVMAMAQAPTPTPAPQRPTAGQDRSGAGRTGAQPAGDERRDAEFVRRAAEGGMKEVELGKLAATRATNAEVKTFANKMVTDHTKANDELKALAGPRMAANHGDATSRQDGSTQAPTGAATAPRTQTSGTTDRSTAAAAGIPARLANLQGAEFDRAYIEQMVDDHDDTVELFEDESEDGDDPQLKKWATDKLPALREHLRMARQLRDKLNTSRN